MRILAALCALLLAGAAQSQETPAVLHDLAPTGTLRAAINLGNPVLAHAGPDGPGGVSVDLARRLGEKLGVPVSFVTYPVAGKVTESARSGAWDICFLAIDPKRAEDIRFTQAYVLIAGSYLVPDASPIRAPADVDRDGVRVSVGRGSAYDLHLTRTLTHATLVRAATSAEAITDFVRDKLEVAAGVHQPLSAYAAKHPEVRLLPGHFMEIPQAMGLPADKAAGAAYLEAFVAAAKAEGFVAERLKANGQDPGVAAP